MAHDWLAAGCSPPPWDVLRSVEAKQLRIYVLPRGDRKYVEGPHVHVLPPEVDIKYYTCA